MARIRRLDYAFSVGKIRAKETRLLTKKDLWAILDLDLESALKAIVERSDYPEELLEIKDTSGLEVILKSQMDKIVSLIKDLLIEKELIEPLLNLEDLQKSLKLAEYLKFDFLIDYLKVFSDLLNIKLFFRFKNLKKTKEEFSKILFDTGYIERKFYLDLYEKPWEDFLEIFSHTRYGLLVKESWEYFKENNSFLRLEAKIDYFLINRLRPAKLIALGPEPLLAYYLAKKNEVNLIRLLVSAKLNNLPKEKVIIRLNEIYG